MTGRRSKTAREIATAVLNRFDPEHNYAGPILNKLLHETDQKQRATDLVLGTIRNRSAIDTVIATFSRRHVERISDKLLNIIRIGTYELVYSPATGQHSIVNEAVENAKAIAPQKQVGFVNAVLRQITRHITNRQIQLPQPDSRCTLAITPLTGCEFDKDFLPDPEALPADYLSTVCSLPKWLVTDWLSEFGAESTRQICLASNRRPTIYLRPNSLKTTTKDLAEKFRQADIDFQIVDVRCSMLDARRESRIDFGELSRAEDRVRPPPATSGGCESSCVRLWWPESSGSMLKVIFTSAPVAVRTAWPISFKKWFSIQLAIKRFGTPTFKYPSASVIFVEFLNHIRNFCGPTFSARASLIALI